MGWSRLRPQRPRSIVAAIYSTWCMSPSPLCSAFARSLHFYRKTQWFLTKSIFWQNDHAKNYTNVLFAEKKTPAAFYKQRKMLLSIFPTIPNPFWTIFHIKTPHFTWKMPKIGKIQLKSFKKLKLFRKRSYVKLCPPLAPISYFIS